MAETLVIVQSGAGFVLDARKAQTPYVTTDPVAARRFAPQEGHAVAALMQSQGWEAVCIPVRVGRVSHHG